MNSDQTNSKPDPIAHLRMLTMKEICEILKLRPQSVYRLIRQKKFIQPDRFTPNRTLFSQVELEAWLNERRQAKAANDKRPAPDKGKD